MLLSPPWPSVPMNPHASVLMLLTCTSIAFLYWFWIELCYAHNGFYPYPIFALLSTWQRVALFAGSGAAMWGVWAGLRGVYAWVNGIEGETMGVGKGGKVE